MLIIDVVMLLMTTLFVAPAETSAELATMMNIEATKL
jgi:hypothetical protein